MFNLTSPVQKNLSKEDHSASDAGAEARFGPMVTETDRFGFILANGTKHESVGPPPELVRQREAKWINIISQWDHILLKNSSKVVKEQCQKGIPASLRAKCWPLLCGATDRMKHNKDLYQTLDAQPALQSWVDVIERDLDRQFPFHEMFQSRDGHGQRGLFRVLKAYTQYQPEEGYCQAQAPVASVLLMHMPCEDTFWCLVQISEQYMPGYYSPLLDGVLFDATILSWVLKRTCPDAHKHLQRHDVQPLMFATDWLMCLFTRQLPFNILVRVWDLFFCYGVRVLFQVAVVLVRRVLGHARQRQECDGQMETLERLRGVKEQVPEEDGTFIGEVCSVPLSTKDLERETERELKGWREERPSSTFDPRGRYHGYRMAWARFQLEEEERNRKEREKSNLSVPLARSASTLSLSLSPSILRKWRKGVKADTNDWEGGGKIGKHHVMEAREKRRDSWINSSPKSVQHIEEEEGMFLEEHKKHMEANLTGQIKLEELCKEQESQTTPTKHREEKDRERTPSNKLEQAKSVKKRQPKETDELNSSSPSQCTDHSEEGDRIEVTEPRQCSVNSQFSKEELDQKDELDHSGQSQVTEQQSYNPKQEMEAGRTAETQEEKTKQVAVNENMVTVVGGKLTQIMDNADLNPGVNTQAADTVNEQVAQMETRAEKQLIENVQNVKMETHTEVITINETEGKMGYNTDMVCQRDGESEAQIEESGKAMEMQQEQEPDVIKETAKESQAVVVDVRDGDTEVLPATELKSKSRTQTEKEANELANAQTYIEENTGTQEEHETEMQTELERGIHLHKPVESNKEIMKETETSFPTESTNQKDNTDLVVQISVESMTKLTAFTVSSADSTTESDEALAESSEKGCEMELPEATEETPSAQHIQKDKDTRTCKQAETPEETQLHLKTIDSIPPQEKIQTSTEPTEKGSAISPDEKMSSLQIFTREQPAAEQPESQATICQKEEKQKTENVTENRKDAEAGIITSLDKIILSDVPQQMHKDKRTMDNPSIASKPPALNTDDSHLPADQAELCKPEVIQAAGSRISTSSGDFRIRKSSSSLGSRLACRLSEDLFTAPQQLNQSESIPRQPEHAPSESIPKSINSNQNPLDTHSGEGSIEKEEQSMESKNTTGIKETMALQSGSRHGQKSLDSPKSFGLFRRLKGEHPKQTKEKAVPKVQIPKILIQDFSDGADKDLMVEHVGDKLTSRERKRRRREQERMEKEEDKLRKKREKEAEKERERERRKPQTRGKSFQVQQDRESIGSKRHSAPYADTYF